MSSRVKTLSDIKDSRIMFEKNVPPFGYIIIIVVMLLMGGIGYWAYKTPKMSVIKATGTVTSTDKTYVMSPYTGQVMSNMCEEGKVVGEGEVLFTIKSTDLNLQLQQLTSSKEILVAKVEMYKKYLGCLEDKTNKFSALNNDESAFYNKYEAYVNKLEQIYVDEAMLKAYGMNKEMIDQKYKDAEKQKEELYLNEVNLTNEAIASIEEQIETMDIQIEALNNGISEYEVKAPSSGVIHVMEEYTEGMIVQTGAKVASIATNNDELEIVTTVSEADASKIKKGDKVDIAVEGLTQSVYGTISGEVVSKDTDVSFASTASGAVSYFKLVVKPDYNFVISKAGDKVNLSNGMGVEARIKYDKVTYLNYVIDVLGLNIRL